jgi:hypothetical protein
MNIKKRLEKLEQQTGVHSEYCRCDKEFRFVMNTGEPMSPGEEFRTCAGCGKLERVLHCTFELTAPGEFSEVNDEY